MTKVYYVVGDTEYKKADVAYCQLKSKERGVKVGDVRVIADEMIYCVGVDRDWDKHPFSKPIVGWKLLKLIDLDSNSDDYYEQKKKIISDFYKKLHNDTY